MTYSVPPLLQDQIVENVLYSYEFALVWIYLNKPMRSQSKGGGNSRPCHPR